ncbi:MAG: hypothetical protein EXQ63_01215 [Ilumatobacteraceae bacterium]|nr:hypothetical protein [Ilumatobacteraceae bacterium]
MKLRDNVFGHFLTYLTLTTISVAQPILQLYGNNLTVFTISKIGGWQVVGFAFLIITAPPLILIALETLASAAYVRGRQIFHRGLVFIALWSVVLLLLRSFSFYAWLIALLATGCIALALLIAYISWPVIGSWVRIMSPLGLVVFISFTISARNVVWVPDIGAADVVINKDKVASTATPREDISVVVVILDEAPLFPLLNADGNINALRFPGFAALADLSTWYRNDTASSQETVESVPSILAGVLPKGDSEPLLANYPQNLFTLLGGNVAMDVQEIMTSLCPKKLCEKVAITSGNEGILPANTVPEEIKNSESVESGSFSRFLLDSSIVLGHKLLPPGLRRHLPSIDEAWGNFGDITVLAEQSAVSSDETTDDAATQTTQPVIHFESTESIKDLKKKWRSSGPVSQVLRLETLIKRSSSQTIPTLHFAHVLLPHRPWRLSTDLRTSAKSNFLPDNPKSVDSSRDQYQRFLQQYVATDTIITKLVTELKASKNWDRTMIVVTADHGITFELGQSKRNVNPKRLDTMEDLYRVPLFIKYPDQTTSEISDCPVMAVDILPTIAAVKGIDAGWKFDGESLLQRCPVRQSRSITWPGASTGLVSDLGTLQSRVDKYSSWVPFDGSVSSVAPFGSLMNAVVTNFVPVEKRVAAWTLEGDEKFASIRTTRFADIPLMINGTIRLTSAMPNDAVGLVLVDGRVSGMIGEVSAAKAGSKISFVSVLESSNLTAGSHQIALAIATGNPLAPTLTYVGVPS